MKKNRYWWIVPLVINVVSFAAFVRYPDNKPIFWINALLVFTDIGMGIWWFSKLIPLATGIKAVVTNLGGEYMHTVTGKNDDGFYNVKGEVNFDIRYPLGYYITTVIHDEDRMWGSPGYDSNLPADPDQTWRDPRNWFEKIFGYHFPGFFTKIEPQLVHTHILKQRNTSTEEEIKNAKFADDKWVVIEEFKELRKFSPIYDYDIVIISTSTGAKGAVTDPKLQDEFIDVNIPISIQTFASNPLCLMTKLTDMHAALVDRTDVTVRDIIAHGTIADLQNGEYSKYDSDFVKALFGMNGEWIEEKGKYYLSSGLDRDFGFRVTKQVALKEWGPATPMAVEMINSGRKIAISQNKIAEETNLGIATRERKIKEGEGEAKVIELVTIARAAGDERIRKAAVQGGVNPEVKVQWKNIGKLQGNVYFGNGAPTPVSNVDSQTGIPGKTKKGGDDEK